MSIAVIPALYMRGGSSKGLFFLAADLPEDAAARDRLLARAVGSPDAFGTQIDGMGGATSSTSKVVVISPSGRPGYDVDYLFGAVDIGAGGVDWSGNCGNLSAAVGPFAIERGLVRAPAEGLATVRIWQANLGAPILARVPMRGGRVLEEGGFVIDGVAFPGAEILLSFAEPEREDARGIFPTGRVVDRLEVSGLGTIEATLIDAGNPSVFARALDLGLEGIELPAAINADGAALARFEALRAAGAVAMGLASSPAEASARRPHTPKLAFVAPSAPYLSTAGAQVAAGSIDLCVRIVSMGKLHHAMTGTGAIALAAAAAVPGTIVAEAAAGRRGRSLRIGHPAGAMSAGAEVERRGEAWIMREATMSRSARILMEGRLRVPTDTISRNAPPEGAGA